VIPQVLARSPGQERRPCSWLAVSSLWAVIMCALAGYSPAQPDPLTGPDSLAVKSSAGKWGDQRDGTFLNPVLPGDFSDLDAIRVGDDFYAISSTMQYSPGMVVLHSRNLIDWQIVSHVVSDLAALDPELGWDRMNRDGRGIWAGSIRYHDGRFWVYFGTPDGGIYMASTSRPEGSWSPAKRVIAAAGWDDPCPFWDDDGKGYLVATRFGADEDGQKYRIHLFSMNAGNDGVVEDSDRILHQSRGSEANKLYKVGGVYLHYFSEVRPEGRVAMMERSSSLFRTVGDSAAQPCPWSCGQGAESGWAYSTEGRAMVVSHASGAGRLGGAGWSSASRYLDRRVAGDRETRSGWDWRNGLGWRSAHPRQIEIRIVCERLTPRAIPAT